jgi:uncharacterized protein YraI
METKFGFIKLTVLEFENWINNLRVGRTITKVQQHHTYSPSYIHFKGSNHFDLQKAMKNYHVTHNGWNDIGQHFTIFPDGTVLTGRSLEKSPACITGQNAQSICIESLGNFDINGDNMNNVQSDAIVKITAMLCKRFGISINSNSIVYHHWFNLSTGERNNGTKNNKSCPGTNFFGGNKVSDCETNFLPLLRKFNSTTSFESSVVVDRYVVVNTKTLNVRTGASASSPIASGRGSATLGSILRVFEEENGWLKISKSQSHWISGKYTLPVLKATVKADVLNVRSGNHSSFPKIGSFQRGEEVFIVEEKNGWCRVNMDEKWVSKAYLIF